MGAGRDPLRRIGESAVRLKLGRAALLRHAVLKMTTVLLGFHIVTVALNLLPSTGLGDIMICGARVAAQLHVSA
jgi:hypothetical protein